MPKRSPSKKPGKRARDEPLKPADYNAFIAGLELTQIRLVAAEVSAPNLPERRPLAPHLHLEEGTYRSSEGQFAAQQMLLFTGTYKDETEPAIRIRVTFEVVYATPARMTDALFSEFKRRNLPLNTWPYCREFVQSTLARMSWPVLLLPAHKTTPRPGEMAAEVAVETNEGDAEGLRPASSPSGAG